MIEIDIKLDELTYEQFIFRFFDNVLYLDGYYVNKRETTKHRKYNIIKQYSRLSNRYDTLTESEVPLTDEIRQRALNEFFSTIKCLTWSERRK